MLSGQVCAHGIRIDRHGFGVFTAFAERDPVRDIGAHVECVSCFHCALVLIVIEIELDFPFEEDKKLLRIVEHEFAWCRGRVFEHKRVHFPPDLPIRQRKVPYPVLRIVVPLNFLAAVE